MLKQIEGSIRKKFVKAKNGNEFPVYYFMHLKKDGVSVGFYDCTIKKELIPAIDKRMGDAKRLDVTLSNTNNSKDDPNTDSFMTWKTKKNQKGEYVLVRDKDGNRIPKIVIQNFAESNILPIDIIYPSLVPEFDN